MRIDEQRSDFAPVGDTRCDRCTLQAEGLYLTRSRRHIEADHHREQLCRGCALSLDLQGILAHAQLAAALPTLTNAPAEKHASVAARMVRDMEGGA